MPRAQSPEGHGYHAAVATGATASARKAAAPEGELQWLWRDVRSAATTSAWPSGPSRRLMALFSQSGHSDGTMALVPVASTQSRTTLNHSCTTKVQQHMYGGKAEVAALGFWASISVDERGQVHVHLELLLPIFLGGR